MRPIQTTRVAIVDLPKALRSSFALSRDVLDVANRCAEGIDMPHAFEQFVLSTRGELPDSLDALVVPGAGCADASEIDALLDSDAGRWIVERMRECYGRNVLIATSCAGVFLAAHAGVLDGRVATTSWFLEGALASRYPALDVRAECLLVNSGPCITGGAATAQAEVMLALVERFAGDTLSDLCAQYLLLDRRRSQRPYTILRALIQHDAQLLQAEAWVHRHIEERFPIASVARAAGLGERTLARRLKHSCGLSPVQFVQRIRIEVARRRLAAGASFEEAAGDVGYADATALRRVFRKHGFAPSRSTQPEGRAPSPT